MLFLPSAVCPPFPNRVTVLAWICPPTISAGFLDSQEWSVPPAGSEVALTTSVQESLVGGSAACSGHKGRTADLVDSHW